MRTMPMLLLPLFLLACSGGGDDGSGDTSAVGDDDDVGGDDDDDGVVYTGCLADGIAVDPGTGIDSYVGIQEGDDMVMVHGPQGGWHIDVGGRVNHTEELVSIEATFTNLADGTLIAGDQVESRVALVNWDDAGCSGDFYGQRIFVDDINSNVGQGDICALDGAELEMTLTVTAIEADPPAVAEITLNVFAALDPADVPECANR